MVLVTSEKHLANKSGHVHFKSPALINFSTIFCTYTPGHEVGEAPIILFVKEQVTDPAAERLFIIFVVDDLQHGLCVA